MRWGNSDAAAPAYVSNGTAWTSDYLAMYHFEQAQDAAADDATSRGNDASLVNVQYPPTKKSDGIFGGAYLFPRNTARAFKDSDLNGTLTLDDFTVSTWVMGEHNDAQDWQNYWAMKTTNGGFLRLEAQNQNPPRLGVYGATIVSPNMTSAGTYRVRNDEWSHVVLTGSASKARLYVNGVENVSANFQEGAQVSELMLGKGIDRNGPGAILDELSFHTKARHERWINATYNSQVPDNTYLNYGTFAGPPFSKTLRMKFTVRKMSRFPILPPPFSWRTPTLVAGGTLNGSSSTVTRNFIRRNPYSAAGLPPGVSINASTGVISGTTDEVGASTFTVTATGSNAAGETRTASKTYTLKISDPDAYPYKMDFTLSGYSGSSTLSQFPVLVTFDTGISGFSYNGFTSATAADLRFFGSNGEELPYEIETWDTAGVSRVWVRAGSVSGTSTVITAAWGILLPPRHPPTLPTVLLGRTDTVPPGTFRKWSAH